MYILFKAIPEKSRECITYVNKLHRSMEAGAPTLSTHYKKLYSSRAATYSCPLQLNNDSYLKY
jgi:hypothetical protein